VTPKWQAHPVIYEINAWRWLHELGTRSPRAVTLGTVPGEEWDQLASLGVDAVWLMGVWERSPLGIQVANRDAKLRSEFARALPDLVEDDIVGSPYCIRRYRVDARLGGPQGLAQARAALARRGVRLILDFVPNHVALDHHWTHDHPEFFIQGTAEDLRRDPESFYDVGGKVVARGRDPFFPAWTDVAQLNAFHPGLRRAAVETVGAIAEQSDGMRCDMAMLMMNDVFARTWGERAGPRPQTEYWHDVIGEVRSQHPDVLFIAEAYWDLEWQLQQQGFDYCYDKRLYDRLVHENAGAVRGHLHADLDYQNRLVRFLENHDEPRAAATLEPQARARAAAVVMMTLPGAKLLHEGQFQGYRERMPVFLRRHPPQAEDRDLRAFYQRLLQAQKTHGGLQGEWSLCEATGWSDNQSAHNLLAWSWRSGLARSLVAANYSDAAAQGRVRLPADDSASGPWRLTDLLSGERYERDGAELQQQGLYVDLKPWAFHYLLLER
jgi:glycosidase